MQRVVLDISLVAYPTRHQLYENLQLIFFTMRQRRLRFAGHCCRSEKELISSTLLCNLQHGRQKIERPHKTFMNQLCGDTNYSQEQLPAAMDDQIGWRTRFEDARRKFDMTMNGFLVTPIV